MKSQWTPSECLEALVRNGASRVKAAKELDIPIRLFLKKIKICRDRGDEVPESPYNKASSPELIATVQPAHDSVPEGFRIRGISTHLGPDGAILSQWHKTEKDDEQRYAIIKAGIEEMCIAIPPQAPIVPPEFTRERLCNLVTFTDYHMGMLAWHKEAGADWDLLIAERVLLGCFEQMMASAPRARVGILAQLGDFLHTDGLVPVTPAHGHVLDADSRYTKIVAVTIRVLRKIINRMLEKHEIVHVLMAEGNHDPTGSIWLQQMFLQLFENEPRVVVIDSPLPYYAIQHGKTMLAFHHGHLKKIESLPQLLAARFAKMWGETTKRYCHTGHLHHVHEKETPGMITTQHPTLAASDAHGARGGWYSERAAQCISYDSEFGQVARVMVTPEMVQ